MSQHATAWLHPALIIQPGDTVLIGLDSRLDHDARRRIHDEITALLGPEVTVVCVSATAIATYRPTPT